MFVKKLIEYLLFIFYAVLGTFLSLRIFGPLIVSHEDALWTICIILGFPPIFALILDVITRRLLGITRMN